MDLDDDAIVEAWLAEPFQRKKPPENNDFKTNLGDVVRSKSELNIANALARHGIPYRYEAELVLSDGTVLHPDFTILDIRHRRILIWEHLGMLDDRGYARDTVKRMRQYRADHIYPGEQLILTEECDGKPLGTTEIERVIEHYFG